MRATSLFGWCIALVTTVTEIPCAKAIVNGLEAPVGDRRFDAIGLVLSVASGGRTCDNGATEPADYLFSGSCVLIGPQTVALCRHQLAHDAVTAELRPLETFRVRFRRSVAGQVENSFVNPLGSTNNCHGVFQERRITAVTQQFYLSGGFWLDRCLATLDQPVEGISPLLFAGNFTPYYDCGDRFLLAGWGRDGECIGDSFAGGIAGVLRVASVGTVEFNRGVRFTDWGWRRCGPTAGCEEVITDPACPGDRLPAGAVGVNAHDSGGALLAERDCVVDGQLVTQTRVVGIIQAGGYGGGWIAEDWDQFAAELGGVMLPTEAFACGSTCRVDVNGDGVATVQDLFEFLAEFAAQSCLGDFTRDSEWSVQDLFQFVELFLANDC